MQVTCTWRPGGSSLRTCTSATWMGTGQRAWGGRVGRVELWGLAQGRGAGEVALSPSPSPSPRKEILQDVSFSVMPGQTLALVRAGPWVWVHCWRVGWGKRGWEVQGWEGQTPNRAGPSLPSPWPPAAGSLWGLQVPLPSRAGGTFGLGEEHRHPPALPLLRRAGRLHPHRWAGHLPGEGGRPPGTGWREHQLLGTAALLGAGTGISPGQG